MDGSVPVPISRRLGQVFLCSLSLMLFEISLVRVFSVIMYYHLAFFVLAVALFGIGVGGLSAQLARSRETWRNASAKTIPLLPVLIALSIVSATIILAILPFQTESTEHQIPRIQWVFCAFLVSAAPFFFGSMFMSAIFAERPREANRLYFVDLAGAGLACLLAIPLLNYLGGMTALFLVACIGVLPVFFDLRAGTRMAAAAASAVIIGAAALGFTNHASDWIIRAAKHSPLGTPLLFAKWNIYSRIGVQHSPDWRGWRLSDNYDGPLPDHMTITQDGRAPAFIVKFDGDFGPVEYLRYDVTALPYYLTDPESTLVIGAGGGRDILTAKLFGVPRVTGVELNPITADDIMRNAFRDYSGNVYGLDGVDVHTDNGRIFAYQTDALYDVMMTSLADTQSASTEGASILSENHLYTVEAFQSYWERLTPNGICCYVGSTLWDGHLVPRLANTMREALEREGVAEPSRHILAIVTPKADKKTHAQCLVMAKAPIGEDMVQRARQACETLGYTLAWPPADADNEWTGLVAPIFDDAGRDAHVAASEYDLRPLEDDRPYIFYASKPRDFFRLMANPGATSTELMSQTGALHFVLDLFLVAFVCVLGLMVSPLLLFRRKELARGDGVLPFLGTFFLLGSGYILIEVAVLQRFFLLLGSPTLTFAVTLFAMLTFSGVGSLWAGRLRVETMPKTLRRIAAILVLIQLASLMAVPALVNALLDAPLTLRFIAVAAALSVIATPMGMLFPCAIRYLGHRGLDMTCWSWGMNGIGSVLGSVGSTIVSLNLGIQSTALVGIVCYALVAVLAGRLGARKPAALSMEGECAVPQTAAHSSGA